MAFDSSRVVMDSKALSSTCTRLSVSFYCRSPRPRIVLCRQRSELSNLPHTCEAYSVGPSRCRRDVLLATGVTSLLSAACAVKPAWSSIIDEGTSLAVFEKASTSVVSIVNFRRDGKEEIQEGTGSGFVWDTRGHIVTNQHCVAKLAADRANSQVTLAGIIGKDGSIRMYPTTIVATDAAHDLAVLKVEDVDEDLVPISFGTSRDLRVGQAVYAIGNPYGLSRTLTAGVVSGLNRSVPTQAGTRTQAIQTDAAISSGNSGGPLLDSSGRMVGVNFATFTKAGTGRSSGVNFALPADLVLKLIPNLIVYRNASGKSV